MATSIVSSSKAGRDLTLFVDNDTAATGFVVVQAPSGYEVNQWIMLKGFSLVPIGTGTMTFISGNAADTNDDKIIWKTSVTANHRIDFAGGFVNCEQNKALKLTTSTGLGEMTISVEYR